MDNSSTKKYWFYDNEQKQYSFQFDDEMKIILEKRYNSTEWISKAHYNQKIMVLPIRYNDNVHKLIEEVDTVMEKHSSNFKDFVDRNLGDIQARYYWTYKKNPVSQEFSTQIGNYVIRLLWTIKRPNWFVEAIEEFCDESPDFRDLPINAVSDSFHQIQVVERWLSNNSLQLHFIETRQ